jgi:putative flippase GtrA
MMPAVVQRHAAQFRELACFGIVGSSGTIVNSVVLWVLVHSCGLPVALASLLATEVAIIHNFVLHDHWTFRAHRTHGSWIERLVRFHSVSLGGLILTVCVVWLATAAAHIRLIPANLLASAIVMVWNYIGNRRWTWGRR